MPWNPFRKKTAQDPFLDSFLAAARRNGVEISKIEGDDVTVSSHGGPHALYLGNVRPRWHALPPEERDPMMDYFIRAFVEASSDEEPDLEHVRNRLMPRVGLPFDSSMEERPPSRNFIGEKLAISLVVDSPQTVSYVRQKHLNAWRTTFDDLYPIAHENLRRKSSRDQWQRDERLPALLMYASGDSYDAARILVLKDLIDPWPVEGVVASIPNRDTLVCVRLDDLKAIEAFKFMISFAHATASQGYGITDQPLWFDGKSWEHIPVTIDGKKVGVYSTEHFSAAMTRLQGM